MSVMNLTHDRSVSPDKYAQSAMSEKPVKYTDDLLVRDRVFRADMPAMYVKYRSFAYFGVGGYLSHCEMVGEFESDLDLRCTRNTYDMDDWLYGYNDPDCGEYGVAPGPDEYARMTWIADLLSDFALTSGSYQTGRSYRFVHEQYGTCTVVVN